MRYLPGRASWDTGGVRDDLRDHVTTNLGDTDAVLVVDETGDLKKGTCTVGVQRRYTGTAGRIENAQVAVHLSYAGERSYDWALAFYRCYSPEPVPLRELVRVAGRRWTVEESFQAGKGLAGLDEHQVHRWTSWRRWIVFAMLAHAPLAVIAANERSARPASAGLIALTCNEIRRVTACPHAGSTWRRRHRYRARTSHYHRQEAALSWP